MWLIYHASSHLKELDVILTLMVIGDLILIILVRIKLNRIKYQEFDDSL